MNRSFFITIFLFFLFIGALYSLSVLAQTTSLTSSVTEIAQNTNFSLTLNIDSVTNLFGVSFDLDFDPALVDFVSIDENSFLALGCQTSLMARENPSGKLIVGYTRLGASCGGVTGSGPLMTLNFKSLDQIGINNFSFSNNFLCLLGGPDCNYITGAWQATSIEIVQTPAFSVVDLNQDGLIDAGDLVIFQSYWQFQNLSADFNQDNVIDTLDLGIIMSQWQ